MAWLRSHQELARHPKTKRLARQLGISLPQAIGHLHLLWWWCMDYAQDGDISDFDPGDIADACCWEDDADRLLEALVTAGFVDRDGELLHVHDWAENAGRIIEARKRNRERMAKTRATHVHCTSDTQSANVQRTCNARAGAR